jgi:hypothetical protein
LFFQAYLTIHFKKYSTWHKLLNALAIINFVLLLIFEFIELFH